MKLNFLVIALLFLLSCEKDPIFGLERGWLLQSEDEEQEELAIKILSPEDGDYWYIGNTYSISFSVNDNNYSGKIIVELIKTTPQEVVFSLIQSNTGYSNISLDQSDNFSSYPYLVHVSLEDDSSVKDEVYIYIRE